MNDGRRKCLKFYKSSRKQLKLGMFSRQNEPLREEDPPIVYDAPYELKAGETMQTDCVATRREAISMCRAAFGHQHAPIPDAFYGIYVGQQMLDQADKWHRIPGFRRGPNPSCYARFSRAGNHIQLVRANGEDRLVLNDNEEVELYRWDRGLQAYEIQSLDRSPEGEGTQTRQPKRYSSPFTGTESTATLGTGVVQVTSDCPAVFVARRGEHSVGVYGAEEEARIAEARFRAACQMGPADARVADEDRCHAIALDRAGHWTEVRAYEFGERAQCYARFVEEQGVEIVTAAQGDALELDELSGELWLGTQVSGEVEWHAVGEARSERHRPWQPVKKSKDLGIPSTEVEV